VKVAALLIYLHSFIHFICDTLTKDKDYHRRVSGAYLCQASAPIMHGKIKTPRGLPEEGKLTARERSALAPDSRRVGVEVNENGILRGNPIEKSVTYLGHSDEAK
jgi:hypothetical protein